MPELPAAEVAPRDVDTRLPAEPADMRRMVEATRRPVDGGCARIFAPVSALPR